MNEGDLSIYTEHAYHSTFLVASWWGLLSEHLMVLFETVNPHGNIELTRTADNVFLLI